MSERDECTDAFHPDVELSATTVGTALEACRPRLERMLALRLDAKLRRRVDPGDILQETFAEVVRRLDDYLAKRPMPFFLWVRFLTVQKLGRVHRRHLGTALRDARREVTPGTGPPASSVSMARAFVEPGASPSKDLERREATERVRAALECMDESDREVLALRYSEGLSNEETAIVLGLSRTGATKRHARALLRLRQALPREEDLPTPP